MGIYGWRQLGTKMDKITIANGISIENINKVVEWTNYRNAKYLEQWAGKEFTFPLTSKQFEPINNYFYSIYRHGEFVGIIQKVKEEGKNVHIGRFVINPEYTGRGIGKVALKALCKHIFSNSCIETITLNVFEYNQNALRLYEKVRFQVVEAVRDENSPQRFKMKLGTTNSNLTKGV